MATVAQALTAIAAQVATTTGGTRAASDILLNEKPAAGAILFQVDSYVGSAVVDSDRTRPLLQVTIAVHHMLADPDDERAYTEAAKATHQEELSKSSTWRALAEILDVVEPVATEGGTERAGNVITYEITVQLTVA